MRGLSPLAESGGHSSSRCVGLSLSRPLLLRSTGSRRAGSVVLAHGLGCSAACGIFPDQGSNLCPLHWQADSQPLHHQGSPCPIILIEASKKPSQCSPRDCFTRENGRMKSSHIIQTHTILMSFLKGKSTIIFFSLAFDL